MKKTIILFLCCLIGYQGYPQKNQGISSFDPQMTDTIQWSEEQIIDILKRGEVLFCKYDLFLERNDTTFYIKNMELPLSKDLFFDSAYIESSIGYGEREQEQNIRCNYLIMNDKWGNSLELTEYELSYLPKLAEYLDGKIQKTPVKDCEIYVPLD